MPAGMPSSPCTCQVVLAVVSDSPVPNTGLDACDAPAVSEEDHAAGPDPLVADQEFPAAQAIEPGRRPGRRITEVPTTAPTLGAVRDLPDAVLGQAIGFRAPAVT